MPSDYKSYFGFVVDEFSELGNNTEKLPCFRYLENLLSDSRYGNKWVIYRAVNAGFREF